MKKLSNYIKEYLNFMFFFILGIAIILITIYLRIIYVRLPKSLYFMIKENNVIKYNIPVITFICIFILIALTILYISIRVYYEKPFEIKNNLITKIVIQIVTTINLSLYTVHCFIVNKIPNSFDKIGNIIMKFYFSNISKYRYLILFAFSLRMIICICFLLDVFIFFEFNYFYKSLILIVLILSLKIWLFNIKDWASNLAVAKSYLLINSKHVGTSEEEHQFEFAVEYDSQNLDLDYHIDLYRNLLTINDYLEDFAAYKSYYTLRFNIIYYILILIGCFYVIGFNIYLIFI